MGYPITTETKLSVSKTAKLLQTLVDLGEEGNKELPKNIQECIDEVLNAQKKLVKEIDAFMHSQERQVDEIEVVSSIVGACPEFLATKSDGDNFKALPIHWFACSNNEEAATKYVPLLAEIGRKHGVGGDEARGGLLVEDIHGINALQCLTYKKSSVMKALKNANPPLLLKEDVRDYHLLHRAVAGGSLEMVKFMKEWDPSCLCYDHSKISVPLRQACVYLDRTEVGEEQKKHRLQIVKYLLHESMLFYASSDTIGGLFNKSTSGKLILDSMVEKYGADDAWSCIKEALSPFPDIPLLHQVIQHSPQNVLNVVTQFPDSVLVRNSQNRLPIHIAFECGMEWGPDLVSIIYANREHLKYIDPVTKWPPFVLAALDQTKSCDLSTVFYLFRGHPEHITVLNTNINKKDEDRRMNESIIIDKGINICPENMPFS